MVEPTRLGSVSASVASLEPDFSGCRWKRVALSDRTHHS